jgi:hypothetical protein
MGNELSQSGQARESIYDYTPTGPHVDHQQVFFREYQMNCAANPQSMMEEMKRWDEAEKDGKILTMTLEQQAELADYVTRKTCELGEEIVVSYAKDCADSTELSTRTFHRGGACALGNVAYVALELRKYPGHEELQERLEKAHKANLCMLQMARLGNMMMSGAQPQMQAPQEVNYDEEKVTSE